ncbi:MAG: FABP family protein, partial [Actinobacteria bacterium]|nr:FABP family protein [Actinomycetota bacterium]
LLWTFDMAAMGQPLVNHLAATLSPANEAALAVDVEE